MFMEIFGGTGYPIAQASNIRIITTKELPIQIDGEPCLLVPSEINITRKNKTAMISNL
jgi:diacylglycerol kinase (ATP)